MEHDLDTCCVYIGNNKCGKHSVIFTSITESTTSKVRNFISGYCSDHNSGKEEEFNLWWGSMNYLTRNEAIALHLDKGK